MGRNIKAVIEFYFIPQYVFIFIYINMQYVFVGAVNSHCVCTICTTSTFKYI